MAKRMLIRRNTKREEDNQHNIRSRTAIRQKGRTFSRANTPVYKNHRELTSIRYEDSRLKMVSTVPLSSLIANIKVQRSYSLTLFGITNAETIDLIFPNWFNRAFVGSGNDAAYRPYDLNMPLTLLKRPIIQYQTDSPITEHGKICAALIGRGFLLAGYKPKIIFTSPELRCIETAHSIQRSLHIDNCDLCVEPSLAEYARFRDGAEQYWFTIERLQQEGILKPNKTYVPLLKPEELSKNEAPQEFVHRLQRFYEHIILNFEDRCVVIVSNITGIFVLSDGTATVPWHLQAPHSYINNCHLCTIEIAPDGKMKFHIVNKAYIDTLNLFHLNLLKDEFNYTDYN
ncbi:Steroid-phosphate phosphatase [Dirofilaria immitis]